MSRDIVDTGDGTKEHRYGYKTDRSGGRRSLERGRVLSGAGDLPVEFYKWRARYRSEGLAGWRERSRRPKSSRPRMAAATEDRIVELRKGRDQQGWDVGAASIRHDLVKEGFDPVPSVTSILAGIAPAGGSSLLNPRNGPGRRIGVSPSSGSTDGVFLLVVRSPVGSAV